MSIATRTVSHLPRAGTLVSLFAAWLVAGHSAGLLSPTRADAPRVLPAGQLPHDQRLQPLKDLDGYFPFAPSNSPDEWAKRAADVRRQLLVANGIWPMPTKTPANAVVHGLVDRDGYTVEKVYLESYPGHFVTGSLFRPKGKTGRLPGVLCPHGHWNDGRFFDSGEQAVREQIVVGAERFEVGGRYILQAMCVQLARMGCVVFHYDMLGYADSQQISFEVAHRYAKQRPHMDTPDNWGFYSTQAELRNQSIMGVQTYNSIRILDWFSELPDVDPARIGVTGGSGGGTQTFMLCGLDPRPAAAFPAVMVSTAMQGGCTCENACLLRVGTGNIEIAALTAPRPLGMTGADDWTKEIATKGFPELKQHYAMLGVPDLVTVKPMLQFGHNYNYVSREVMYHFFNKHLKIGLPEPVIEEDYKPLSIAEMRVWDDQHPRPPAGDDYERSLLKWITADAEKQLSALVPADTAGLAKYREVVGGGVAVVVGRGLPPAGAIEYEETAKRDCGTYLEFAALLRNKAQGEELPAVFLYPKQWNRRVVVWVHGSGKAGLYGPDGEPAAEIRALLAGGTAVAGVDLLYQGEFLADGQPPTRLRRVDNPREFAAYTLGYNHALFAQRAHDILSVVSFCRNHDMHKPEHVYLAGVAGGGPFVAAALAQCAGAVDRAAIDTAGFRFAQLKSIEDVNLLPGAVKYGDLPGMLSLAAPAELWLAGEGSEAPPLVTQCYKAAGAADKITVYRGTADGATAAAVEWLMR